MRRTQGAGRAHSPGGRTPPIAGPIRLGRLTDSSTGVNSRAQEARVTCGNAGEGPRVDLERLIWAQATSPNVQGRGRERPPSTFVATPTVHPQQSIVLILDAPAQERWHPPSARSQGTVIGACLSVGVAVISAIGHVLALAVVSFFWRAIVHLSAPGIGHLTARAVVRLLAHTPFS